MITAASPVHRNHHSATSPRRPSPAMAMPTPQQLLCQILGIGPADLSQANRLLRLPPDERNPAIIDQAARWCFSRVQAAQPSLGPDVARWMMQTIAEARQVMLQHSAAAAHPMIPSGPATIAPPPSPVAPPPVPAAVPQPQNQPRMGGPQILHQQPQWQQAHTLPAAQEPAIVINKTIPRRRGGFDTDNLVSLLGVAVILIAGFTFGKLFIDQWWKDLQRVGKGGGGGGTPSIVIVSNPPVVPAGGGSPKPEPAPAPPVIPPQPALAAPDVPKAQALMRDALRAARTGAYDEADLCAAKALRAARDYEEAKAMRLLVAYQRQYTDLATQAFHALNGNNTTIFLGDSYGEGAFVERTADSVTFRVSGGNRKFTINELNGTPGVRFRITEQYLDNADNPANDLILGAWHLIMQQTSDGRKDAEGSKSAARHRWEKAVINGNADIKEQGTLMMKLLTLDLND